jgi:hypothetical protein
MARRRKRAKAVPLDVERRDWKWLGEPLLQSGDACFLDLTEEAQCEMYRLFPDPRHPRRRDQRRERLVHQAAHPRDLVANGVTDIDGYEKSQLKLSTRN